MQHQHNFFKKASWNQIHSRIAIRLKLTSLISQFPPHNPMWETLTFLQNYRAVTEIIFKLFKKKTDFWHFLNVQVLAHSFLNISIYHYGIYTKSKDKYPFNSQSGFSGLFHMYLLSECHTECIYNRDWAKVLFKVKIIRPQKIKKNVIKTKFWHLTWLNSIKGESF